MNHVVDDYGNTVIAVGAPGSIERVKVEYPKLIERLTSLYWQAYESPGCAVDEAIEMIRAEGVTSELETVSLLKASQYGQEPHGSVTHIVCMLSKTRPDLTGQEAPDA